MLARMALEAKTEFLLDISLWMPENFFTVMMRVNMSERSAIWSTPPGMARCLLSGAVGILVFAGAGVIIEETGILRDDRMSDFLWIVLPPGYGLLFRVPLLCTEASSSASRPRSGRDSAAHCGEPDTPPTPARQGTGAVPAFHQRHPERAAPGTPDLQDAGARIPASNRIISHDLRTPLTVILG